VIRAAAAGSPADEKRIPDRIPIRVGIHLSQHGTREGADRLRRQPPKPPGSPWKSAAGAFGKKPAGYARTGRAIAALLLLA
jgi:hypothetical protein